MLALRACAFARGACLCVRGQVAVGRGWRACVCARVCMVAGERAVMGGRGTSGQSTFWKSEAVESSESCHRSSKSWTMKCWYANLSTTCDRLPCQRMKPSARRMVAYLLDRIGDSSLMSLGIYFPVGFIGCLDCGDEVEAQRHLN